MKIFRQNKQIEKNADFLNKCSLYLTTGLLHSVLEDSNKVAENTFPWIFLFCILISDANSFKMDNYFFLVQNTDEAINQWSVPISGRYILTLLLPRIYLDKAFFTCKTSMANIRRRKKTEKKMSNLLITNLSVLCPKPGMNY